MSQTIAANPLPRDMEEGTRGPVALAVNAFLAGIMSDAGIGSDDDGFIVDEVYGEKAARRMACYQQFSSLDADGGCGPMTRAEMQTDGFDIELIAVILGGTTIFVQRDGSEISWSPNAEPVIAAAVPIPMDRDAGNGDPGTAE